MNVHIVFAARQAPKFVSMLNSFSFVDWASIDPYIRRCSTFGLLRFNKLHELAPQFVIFILVFCFISEFFIAEIEVLPVFSYEN